MLLDHQTPKSNHTTRNPLKKTGTYVSLLLLGAGLGFSGGYVALRNSVPESTSPQAIVPQNKTARLPGTKPVVTQNPNFITNVVEQVGPAVVRINASRTVATRVPDTFRNPMFREFFRFQLPDVPKARVEQGTGSGFIIDTDGYILTNAHVVDNADSVNVILKDGRQLKGTVVGSDPLTDVAVIQIEAENLPTVALGDSDQLTPGEWAIAIGNPLGLDSTVTTGIISATGRSSSQVGVPDKRVEFIQTDAAINPGNSGGPLLNASGEVIGMNTAIIRGAQGLGFAVPINTVEEIAEQLIVDGKVEHPYLGIQMVTLTPKVKQQINSNLNAGLMVDEEQGVLIAKVIANSPAAKAGLRAGDVIRKINDQPVKDATEVQKSVAKTKVGSDLILELRRNQRDTKLTVRPGAFPTGK